MERFHRCVVPAFPLVRATLDDLKVRQELLVIIGSIRRTLITMHKGAFQGALQRQLDNSSTAQGFITMLTDQPGYHLPVEQVYNCLKVKDLFQTEQISDVTNEYLSRSQCEKTPMDIRT